MSARELLQIGVSSCLLGNRVRYDGAHKLLPLLLNVDVAHTQWVAICPEWEAGLGIPREPIQLLQRDSELRLVRVSDPAIDVTLAIEQIVQERRPQVQRLDGYIFKSRSPSCAVQSVVVQSEHGPVPDQAGLFARRVMDLLPQLPVVEDSALASEHDLRAFLTRARAYHRQRRENRCGSTG